MGGVAACGRGWWWWQGQLLLLLLLSPSRTDAQHFSLSLCLSVSLSPANTTDQSLIFSFIS